jgi:Flp pilus assembly protein protease CpaA
MVVLWIVYISVADLMTHRIKNSNNIFLLALSLILALTVHSDQNILSFLIGAATGLLVLLPFYRLSEKLIPDLKLNNLSE